MFLYHVVLLITKDLEDKKFEETEQNHYVTAENITDVFNHFVSLESEHSSDSEQWELIFIKRSVSVSAKL